MNRLPDVKVARINHFSARASSVEGAFVDPEWVFHDIAAGRWIFQLPDRAYEVGPGNLVLLPPGVLHIVRPVSAGPREHRVVHFLLPLPEPELLDAPHVVAIDRPTKAVVRAHFLTFLREQQSALPHSRLRQSALMADLLALYLRHAPRAVGAIASPLPLSANIERALRCVQARLGDTALGVRDLAAAAGLSPSHFRRIFSTYTGTSPKSYILRQRLERAQAALLGGAANCSLAADACGFSSVHAFSKAFRRQAGVSPKRWLARLEQ